MCLPWAQQYKAKGDSAIFFCNAISNMTEWQSVGLVSIHDVLKNQTLMIKPLFRSPTGVYKIGDGVFDYKNTTRWDIGTKRRITRNLEAMRNSPHSDQPNNNLWMDTADF